MLIGGQLRLRRVVEQPGRDQRRILLAAQEPRLHGGAAAQDVPHAFARVHVAEVGLEVDELGMELGPLLLVDDHRVLGQGEGRLARVVERAL